MSRCLGFLLIHVWDVFKTFCLCSISCWRNSEWPRWKETIVTVSAWMSPRPAAVQWPPQRAWLAEEKLCNFVFRILVNSSFGTDEILHLYAFPIVTCLEAWKCSRDYKIMHLVNLSFCCLVIHAHENHGHFSRSKVSKQKLEFFLVLKWLRLKPKIIDIWFRVLFWVFVFYVFCFIQTGMLMH